MFSIYIATVLALLVSDMLPAMVHGGSSSRSGDSHDSKGSSDSRDDDKTYCKKADPYRQAVENKINYLKGKKQPLPKCTCGTSGTISKIDITDANSGKTTSLLTCLNCTGPQVPVKSATECCNVADVFRPDLDQLCKIVSPRCKNFTVYRCACPTVSTTSIIPTTSSRAAPATTSAASPATISVSQPPTTISAASPATISVSQPSTTPSAASPATISVSQPPTTTQSTTTAITIVKTPFRGSDYMNYTYYIIPT